jgi:GAF domain-containing protein
MAQGPISELCGEAPGSVASVPCVADGAVVGALEVAGKTGGGGFTFDDVELVGLLGEIAGPALAELRGLTPDVRSPGELADELRALAAADPVRYTQVALLIDALLAER